MDYSDAISSLPTDTVKPSHSEVSLVNTLFSPNHSELKQRLGNEIKELLILILLFMVLSLPQADELITKFVHVPTNSPGSISYILLVIKAVIMVILFWIIRNFYLAKRN